MTSDKDPVSRKADGPVSRKTWQPMKLAYVGDAKDIVRSGGGKVSISEADSGDPRKPKGQG
jgi:hypothetical protein